MIPILGSWTPAAVLAAGALLTFGGVREQVAMPLRADLSTSVPTVMAGMTAQDVPISKEEQRVAGMDNFVMRAYAPAGAAISAAAFTVYVGYYQQQTQGNSIHSPRNCLPGGGWEPLTSSRESISTPAGIVPVNRYLIGNGDAKALVLYWYQGRGRMAANEYAVKWHLLRDQALRGRSDEALVRIIVPVDKSEQEAYELAVKIGRTLAPAVASVLPV